MWFHCFLSFSFRIFVFVSVLFARRYRSKVSFAPNPLLMVSSHCEKKLRFSSSSWTWLSRFVTLSTLIFEWILQTHIKPSAIKLPVCNSFILISCSFIRPLVHFLVSMFFFFFFSLHMCYRNGVYAECFWQVPKQWWCVRKRSSFENLIVTSVWTVWWANERMNGKKK